jgi:hypothetical protein
MGPQHERDSSHHGGVAADSRGLHLGALPLSEVMNMPPKRPSADELARQCDRFNAAYPIGSDVIRFKLVNPRRDGTPTKVRSEAWVMGGHSAVVLVDGFSGGQSLDAIGAP